jgi:serine/threonine protein kinase
MTSQVRIDALEIGTVLRDRYEIVEQIGMGSFGIMYIAEDRDYPDRKSFAIKQFNPLNTRQKNIDIARAKFNDEANTLARLAHDLIPKLYARFEEDGQFYIVQDLVEGVPLAQELKAGDRKNERYLKKLLIDLLTPLTYVHQKNIIHRDLKPDNLIRRSDGRISLIDFGAGKEVLDSAERRLCQRTTEAQGTTIGTPAYMPSEQAIGQAKLSSDIYAIGKIAIQAATGIHPSKLEKDPATENPIWQDLAPQISQDLKNILSRMVEYNFKARYPTATEALQEVNSQSIDTPEPPTVAVEKIVAKTVSSEKTPPVSLKFPWLNLISILITTAILLMGLKSWNYAIKPRISDSTIVVGILSNSANYQELSDYLSQEFVPANYVDYLKGKRIKVVVEGSKKLSYGEVKKRLQEKKWDITFAKSPMISRFAQKQGYSYLAGMFPDSTIYNSGIFVRKNSPIRSISDIKPSTVVALGDFNSASSFYMPAYDLYGKTFSRKLARSESPMDMVGKGKADVGAATIDGIQSNKSKFRIIHQSRDIPGSGVYLSPYFSSQHQKIKQVLLDAPANIRDSSAANYDDVPEADYTEFEKIATRVEKIVECVDFDRNPIDLFCRKKAPPGIIKKQGIKQIRS